jgi:hypothetical protein
MVQYFSQVQRVSGLSHIAQTTGPGIGASKTKLYLSMMSRGKTRVY